MAAPKSASVSGFSEPPMNGASVSGIRPAETSLKGIISAFVQPASFWSLSYLSNVQWYDPWKGDECGTGAGSFTMVS
jgi:hypothetical protein